MFWNCFVLFPLVVALATVVLGFYRIHFPLTLGSAQNANRSHVRCLYSARLLGDLGCSIAVAAILIGGAYSLKKDAYISSDYYLISAYYLFLVGLILIFKAFFSAAIPKGIFLKSDNKYLCSVLTKNGAIDMHLNVKPGDKKHRKTIIKSIIVDINSLSNFDIILSPPYHIDLIVNQIEKGKIRVNGVVYKTFKCSICKAILITFIRRKFRDEGGSCWMRVSENSTTHEYVFFKNT